MWYSVISPMPSSERPRRDRRFARALWSLVMSHLLRLRRLKPLSRPGEIESLYTKHIRSNRMLKLSLPSAHTLLLPPTWVWLSLNLITVGGRRTRKRAKWSNQPLIFSEKKRKPCLEKNRITADHSRANKKQKEERLRIRSHELFSCNKLLKKSVSYMTKDVQQLRSVLRTHSKSRGCQKTLKICETLVEWLLSSDELLRQRRPTCEPFKTVLFKARDGVQ